MIDTKKNSIATDKESYLCCEGWFELETLMRWKGDNKAGVNIKGKRIINSYGKVREVWEDGTYQDVTGAEQTYGVSSDDISGQLIKALDMLIFLLRSTPFTFDEKGNLKVSVYDPKT